MDDRGEASDNLSMLEYHSNEDEDGTKKNNTNEEVESTSNINTTGEIPENDIKDIESELKSVSEIKHTSELQNHVDCNSGEVPENSDMQESESGIKRDILASLGLNDQSSTTLKVDKEDSDNIDERLKDINTPEDTISRDRDDCTQESTSENIIQEEKTDNNIDNEIEEGDEKKDEVGKPEFETAPNVSIDEPQEDHTQALDPFDALLRDIGDSTSETKETATQATVNLVDEDDDNDNVDHADDLPRDDEEEHHTETSLDDSVVTELNEEPGADEEVCLLPDTEREISDADKAEAEKVLAEKRKQAEAEAAATEAQKEPKKENEVAVADERRYSTEEPSHNEEGGASENAEAESVQDDLSQENGEKENDESTEAEVSFVSNTIQEISPCTATCVQCKIETSCSYRFATKEVKENYICGESCLKLFQADHPSQYTVACRKYLIEEITPKPLMCSECEEKKLCYFYYNFDGEDTNYCSEECLHSMMADEKEKYIFKRLRIIIEEKVRKDVECLVCKETKKCQYHMLRYGKAYSICDLNCVKMLNDSEEGRYTIRNRRSGRKQAQTNTTQANTAPSNPPLLKLKVISNATDKYLDEAYKIQAKTPAMIKAAREERERTFVRTCSQCNLILTSEEKILTWETMDFCKETCLGRYQNDIGSQCANCSNPVQHTSLGKYCVRFGYVIRQFCNSGCLEEFKKGLKICCYCQRDISVGHEGFLAPVGDKGQFKDFCSQICVDKFDQMSKNPVPQPVWAKCAVCSLQKATPIEVEVGEDVTQRLCSDPCFAAFKFVNNIFPDQCRWCKKYFERKLNKCFTIYESSSLNCFCSKSCMNVYISNSRHIVPCNWCKVKKYNFDMIRRDQPNGQSVLMCSLNCLNLYQVSVNAVSSKRTKCDMCKRTSLAQYHLTMSDATVRNFCTYQCVMSFQGQYSKHAAPLVSGDSVEQTKAVPTGAPRRTYSNKNNAAAKNQRSSGLPVISNVKSLAPPPPLATSVTRGKSKRLAAAQAAPAEPEPQAPSTPPPSPRSPPHLLHHPLQKFTITLL
ncbi:unnamed protein product [Parnassius apollo]|uniref:(apollo) hypothetical protein n=1 Tax=Parnassius apollo TaxID=110799 RepID=A0A8S3WFF6_PARAO|nr:unnamed protein product [Parnassius apollo]